MRGEKAGVGPGVGLPRRGKKIGSLHGLGESALPKLRSILVKGKKELLPKKGKKFPSREESRLQEGETLCRPWGEE